MGGGWAGGFPAAGSLLRRPLLAREVPCPAARAGRPGAAVRPHSSQPQSASPTPTPAPATQATPPARCRGEGKAGLTVRIRRQTPPAVRVPHALRASARSTPHPLGAPLSSNRSEALACSGPSLAGWPLAAAHPRPPKPRALIMSFQDIDLHPLHPLQSPLTAASALLPPPPASNRRRPWRGSRLRRRGRSCPPRRSARAARCGRRRTRRR